jgi:hypothetical protein
MSCKLFGVLGVLACGLFMGAAFVEAATCSDGTDLKEQQVQVTRREGNIQQVVAGVEGQRIHLYGWSLKHRLNAVVTFTEGGASGCDNPDGAIDTHPDYSSSFNELESSVDAQEPIVSTHSAGNSLCVDLGGHERGPPLRGSVHFCQE